MPAAYPRQRLWAVRSGNFPDFHSLASQNTPSPKVLGYPVSVSFNRQRVDSTRLFSRTVLAVLGYLGLEDLQSAAGGRHLIVAGRSIARRWRDDREGHRLVFLGELQQGLA